MPRSLRFRGPRFIERRLLVLAGSYRAHGARRVPQRSTAAACDALPPAHPQGRPAHHPLSRPGLWQAVKDTIASMPQDTARARAHSHRVRWLFTLLYPGGLRIAGAGGHKLGQRDGPVLRAARHRRHHALVAAGG
jgi:hypothetical protein